LQCANEYIMHANEVMGC